MAVDLYFKRHEELIVIRFLYYLQFISECLRVRDTYISKAEEPGVVVAITYVCRNLFVAPPPPPYKFCFLLGIKNKKKSFF